MNYTIENRGGINLLHIGDTVRPATDAEVDLVAQLSVVKSTNYAKLYGMLCEALDHNGMYAQLQPSGDWFKLVRKGPEATVQIINGDVVGTVSDEQIQVVLMDALHRIAERNGYPEWAHSSASDVFEAYKTWPEDLRARLSVNDLRRMTGWKPQSQEDHITDALEEGGIIDAYQAMDRRVAEAKKRGRPRGVTYSANHDNFYDAYGRGLGMDFYITWREHRHDFPAYAPKGNENGN